MLLIGLNARALRLLCLPVFLIMALGQMRAQSTTVVISQVYGGGGGGGATTSYLYNQDYVEIFNLSTSSVDISGWSVQYMSAAGTSATTSSLLSAPGTAGSSTTVLPAGGYYLFAGATGSSTTPVFSGAALPVTPDVTAAVGNFNIAGAGGKVFLVNNSTPLVLTANTSCTTLTTGSGIIDYVGQGAATCYEGAAAAPTPTGLSADVRTSRCIDTNQNGTDFINSTTAVPHNSSSTAAPCGAVVVPTNPTLTLPTATPTTVTAGSATVLNVKYTAGTGPASTTPVVTVDTSAFSGGSTTTALFDDGAHGDGASGDGTYGLSFTVPAGTTPGNYTLNFSVKDAQSRTGTTSVVITVQAAIPPGALGLSTGTATPSTVTSGLTTTLTAKISLGTNPTSTGVTVTANTSSIASGTGTTAIAMYDDGSSAHGDTTAGDGIYSVIYTVPAGTTPNTYTVTFNASDAQSRTATTTTSVTVVAPIPPVDSATISASTSTALLGGSVSFTVVATGNMGAPTGTVTIKDASGTLGTATLVSAGTWVYTTTTLSLGTHVVYAVLGADSVYPAYTIPTANAATVTITPVPVPDFAFTVANASILLSSNAKSGTIGLGVNMVNGFNSTVTFACSGLPSGSRCAFSPASLSTSGTSTLIIAIDGASLQPHSSPFGKDKSAGTLAAFTLLALPLLLRRKLRKKLGVAGTMLGVMLLGTVMMAVSGCSSSTTTTTGTSAVTVTATGGGVTKTATVSVVVQ